MDDRFSLGDGDDSLARDFLVARQVDGEGRAFADGRLDGDIAACLVDNAMDRGETEAGAGADVLGGEEGLEDMRQGFRRNAGAAVLDIDGYPFAGGEGFFGI